MKGKKNAMIFKSQYRCVEIHLYLMRFSPLCLDTGPLQRARARGMVSMGQFGMRATPYAPPNIDLLCDLTLKFIKKGLSIKEFSQISEVLYKYFLQLEVEE